MATRSLEKAYRDWLFSQTPQSKESAVVSGVTAANSSLLEISYLGRTGGAVQVMSSDGNAWVATFKVQGTLLDNATTVGQDGTTVFVTPSQDSDYVDITTISANAIYQIPTLNPYSRIRVICSGYTSGAPKARIL